MLRQSRFAALLSVCLSTLVLLQIGQVGAARDLQLLPGKSVLQKDNARRLLQTPPSLGTTGGSDPLNSNALSGGLNTGSSSTSILGSGGTTTGGTTTGGTTTGGTTTGGTTTALGALPGSTTSQSSSSGSLLDAVQSGSINPSPPPLLPGVTGITSPPPVSQQPQLNYNPLSGFNSGSGRRLRTHAA